MFLSVGRLSDLLRLRDHASFLSLAPSQHAQDIVLFHHQVLGPMSLISVPDMPNKMGAPTLAIGTSFPDCLAGICQSP
jgi:hypothetical protein